MVPLHRVLRLLLAGGLAGAVPASAQAARIADLTAEDWAGQAVRFLTLADPAVRSSLAGCLLLGIACGVLGSFLLVRRMSLTGDALSHAVLPGILLGFLWQGSKDPAGLLVGACVTGLLSMALLLGLQRTTRLKEDALLGMVLTGFYALGVFLLSLAQRSSGGAHAGIEKYLLGQASALGWADVQVIAVSAALSVTFVVVCFKELATLSFDRGFAEAAGMPVKLLERLLLGLLTFTIVAALQAVGVVLVSALLITPAATALLLTRRLALVCLLAALFGMGAAATGSFVSYLDSGLPTGPFIVLAAALGFGIALLFAPGRGLVSRWLGRRRDAARIQLENSLKRVWHRLEGGPAEAALPLEALAPGKESGTADLARRLCGAGFASLTPDGRALTLTPEGARRAATVVRNHRLWELYLTHAASVPADHVHDDAEDMEHFLDEETVRRLERRLEFAREDPHGRAIPTPEDLSGFSPHPPAARRSRPEV